MGTGKTASAIWAADFLMKQGVIKKVLVLCPLSIMDSAWRNDLFTFCMHRTVDVCHGSADKRKKIIAHGAEFLIINYDGLKIVHEEVEAAGFDLIIADECFVAGTPVHTPNGKVAIEKLRAGDEVFTSNGVHSIKRLIPSTSKNLVRVTLSNGRFIDTTKEHPFYTDLGWVTAENLKGRRLISASDMRDMREYVSDNAKQVAVASEKRYKHWADLLSILWTEEVAPTTSRKIGANCMESGGEQTSHFSIRKNTRDAQKAIGLTETHWPQTTNTQGQRYGDDRLRETCYGSTVGFMGMELPSSVGDTPARLSHELQVRLREPDNEGRDRSGWKQPCSDQKTGAGQKKRSQVSGIWVDSVTDIKQGCETPVFNIEVEGTPNYFVGDGVLVHNCTHYKNAQTDRWKVLNKLVTPEKWLWLMTGTPAAQGPTDAFGLAKLVNPTGVPRSFGAFRDQVMYKITQFKWLPKPTASDTVHRALQPAIRYTKEECLDLPEMTYNKREVEMTRQQKKYYKELKDQMVIAASGEEVTTTNAAVNLNKLLQLSSGAIYTDDGEALEFDIKHRYKVLKEVIDETTQKVLIFVPFKHSIGILADKLNADGIATEVISGAVSASNRTDIFKRFQEQPNPQVLVIQPQAAAHGVTLTAANAIVWWGPTPSLETYLQANARVHRAGQRHPSTVVQLQGSPAESHVYAMLDNKIDCHSEIIDLYKQLLD